MAPQVGLEPTTLRLTAGCSAIELLRSGSTLACALELSKKSYQRLRRIGNSRAASRLHASCVSALAVLLTCFSASGPQRKCSAGDGRVALADCFPVFFARS